MYPVFAVPSLAHAVCMEFFGSYIATSQLLQAQGVTHTFIPVNGDAYLAHARNRLVHRFLTDWPQGTDLFFLDDDIGWEPEAVLRLLNDPEDVVAGVYPKKQDKLEFPVVLDKDAEGHVIISKSGLYKALRVPTGFLRIRRHVLETMAARAKTYRVERPEGTETIAEVFRMGVYDGLWWGEDFDWCNQWRDMGGDIWVDAQIMFTHSGRKQWSARLLDSARPARPQDVAGLRDMLNQLPPASTPWGVGTVGAVA